jgi:hypothetical protein
MVTLAGLHLLCSQSLFLTLHFTRDPKTRRVGFFFLQPHHSFPRRDSQHAIGCNSVPGGKTMRFFVRSLVLVLVLANMPLCLRLFAQSGNGVIAGTVQDSAGSALIGARVVVEPTGRETASDNQGNFRISDLPAGQYTITASYVGFTAYTTTVTVAPGQTANVTAALQVGSSADSVIVSAGRLQGDAEAINVERSRLKSYRWHPRA